MMDKLKGLKPERVFYYFEELTKIPRGSYDEEKVSNYIKSIGERLGLETIQDDLLNVIIRKPASPGYENAEGVIIQGHMDMVCEKESDSSHDFQKDPIPLIVDGDYIGADKTTLGADNGIAIAMGLAILEDDTLQHPAIELLATSSEETEMDGALGLSEDILKGTRLLNLDSEEEGVVIAGSAGGELIKIEIQSAHEELQNYIGFDIEIKGLMGGHSGMEINKPRGNANKILGNLLKDVAEMMEIRLISITGGTKDNAIPRNATAKIALAEKDRAQFENIMEEIKRRIIDENREKEPGIHISVVSCKAVAQGFSKSALTSVIELLGNLPTGVFTMLEGYKNTVESSSNLAIVKTTDEKITVQISLRSSIESRLKEIEDLIIKEAEKVNAVCTIGASYPEWEYRPESNLRKAALAVYEDVFGAKMEVAVIHAGLECGAIAKKYPNMDLISFGPNIYDVHTPKEKISISSTERIYEYTVALLKSL